MKFNTEKSKKIIQKIIISFIAIAVIFVFDFWIFSPQQLPVSSSKDQANTDIQAKQNYSAPTPIVESDTEKIEQEEKVDIITKTSDEILKQIKSSVDLLVPFTSQSPYASWDDLHNEACEEAVLIMAKYWIDNKELNKETAEQEILDSVAWQEKNFGGHYDLQVLDIVDLARRYFNIEKIFYSSVESISDIKYQLSKGNLVIAPMAGRLLDNPYYKSPGPPYHAVVVKGYNNKEIITNDPGTRRGADFPYSYDNFLESIHDWPYELGESSELNKNQRAQEVLKGEKVMIVVEKQG